MKEATNELRLRDLRRQFDRAASSFDGADFLCRQTADGLMERLQPMQLTVNTLLDLGGATGGCAATLAKRFPRARLVNVDLSARMLEKAKARRGFFSRQRQVQADASLLPFASRSADLVFANMLLPWLADPTACFAGVSRVLRKDGLFSFSTLGPDSFAELREAWFDLDDYPHVQRFADMHDVGDALLRSGLRDPVLDVDFVTVSYADADALLADLAASGARNVFARRASGLTGKTKFAEVKRRLAAVGGGDRIELRFEIVFGHAWGSGADAGSGEYVFSADQIGRRPA